MSHGGTSCSGCLLGLVVVALSVLVVCAGVYFLVESLAPLFS